MEKENASPLEDTARNRRLKLPVRASAILCGSAILLGTVSAETDGRSGETRSYQPDKKELATYHSGPNGREFNVASLNVHGRVNSHQVQTMFNELNLSVLFMQEVPVSAAEILEKYTKGLHVSQVVADPAVEGIYYSGQSNLIITEKPQFELQGRQIDGDFLLGSLGKAFTSTVKQGLGFLEGEAFASDSVIGYTKQARQEQRAALAVTIHQNNGDKTEEIRLITSHISGVNEVEEDQRNDLKAIIEDNLKDGRRTIFCGDLNARPEVIVPWLVRMGFTAMETGPTHTNGYQTLDYCAEWVGKGGERVLAKARVEKKYKGSDHFTVVVEGELEMPSEIAQKYPKTISTEQERANMLSLHVKPPNHPASMLTARTTGFTPRH